MMLVAFGPFLPLLLSLYSVCLKKYQVGETPEVGRHGGEEMSKTKKSWVAFVFYMQGIFMALMVKTGRLSQVRL